MVLRAALVLLHHLCGSHARSCRAHTMLVASMRAYHLILWVLRWPMRANALDRVMGVRVAVSDRHVHPVLYIVLRLLGQLRLVSHVVYARLTKSTGKTH